MCVARSRSPRLNHASSLPSARSASVARNVSPSRPQPRSRSARPASQYVTESMSGETWRPWRVMSSPVLTTTATSPGGTARTRPRRNLPAPTPPASATTFTARERSSLRHVAVATSHAVRRALARAEQGKALSLDEATELMEARGADLDRLLTIAGRVRDLGNDHLITYSRKVFIPLTMLCRDRCHYCTFAKPPARTDAPFLTTEEAVASA